MTKHLTGNGKIGGDPMMRNQRVATDFSVSGQMLGHSVRSPLSDAPPADFATP